MFNTLINKSTKNIFDKIKLFRIIYFKIQRSCSRTKKYRKYRLIFSLMCPLSPLQEKIPHQILLSIGNPLRFPSNHYEHIARKRDVLPAYI